MDIGDWKPWVELFRNGILRDEIETVIFKRDKEDWYHAALALSVAKWHPHRGVMAGIGNCGLCIFQSEMHSVANKCKPCSANKICGDGVDSIFFEWVIARTPELKRVRANRMYEQLLDLYRDVSNHTERSV